MPKPPPAADARVAAAVPDYEVKLFLDPAKVLDAEFKPARETDRALDLKNSSRRIAMLFLDARPPQLHAGRWNVRARRFEDSDELELSYKRRYPVEPGRLADALAVAAADGFDAGEDDYAAQVEWGFRRETLSFTRKKELEVKGLGELDLPAVEELRVLAARELPGKLDRWEAPGRARAALAAAHGYGPVAGKRWAGEWPGPDLAFEVWQIRTASGQGYEPVVELSFKEEALADAAGHREKLTAFVRDRGWLVERDVLKTAMILDRY
jgi:hypothetical protein